MFHCVKISENHMSAGQVTHNLWFPAAKGVPHRPGLARLVWQLVRRRAFLTSPDPPAELGIHRNWGEKHGAETQQQWFRQWKWWLNYRDLYLMDSYGRKITAVWYAEYIYRCTGATRPTCRVARGAHHCMVLHVCTIHHRVFPFLRSACWFNKCPSCLSCLVRSPFCPLK